VEAVDVDEFDGVSAVVGEHRERASGIDRLKA
jgi:hypothetical protein